MANWREIIGGIGDFLEGASYAAIIENWLTKSFIDGLNGIEEYVKTVPEHMIDNMDSTFLMRIHVAIDPDAKDTLVKYYAFFKIIEFNKYGKFRGFPPNPLNS